MNHTQREEIVEVLREYAQEPPQVEITPLTDAEIELAVDASIELMCVVLPDELEPALRRYFPTDEEFQAFIAGVSAGLHHRPRFKRRCPAHHGSQSGNGSQVKHSEAA